MLRLLALLSMRSLFAWASPEAEDDDEALVEDEETRPQGGIPGFPDGKLPTADELLKMLDSMSGLSDEDKEAIRADLLKKGSGGAGAEGAQQIAAGSAFPEFLVLLGMLAFITLIFGSKMELLDKFSSKFDLSDELRDKLAGMVMRYKSLDATGKAEFLGLAKDSLAEQLSRLVAKKQATHEFTWLLVAVAFIVLLFVFFGYKLYKSLSERERKREEKKKNKQMKKKK